MPPPKKNARAGHTTNRPADVESLRRPSARPPCRLEQQHETERRDVPPSPERSALMGRIRGRDTAPEMLVRRMAHALGFRFRLHVRGLPGRPDIVFPAHRKIIFVNGCFWHRHLGCVKTTTPKTRIAFWQAKFDGNVARDVRTTTELRRAGWDVLIVWECQTNDPVALSKALTMFLGAPSPRRVPRIAAQ